MGERTTDYVSYIRSMVGHKPVFMGAACVAVCDERGRVLLERRGSSDRWGFPGGLAELGESLEETAVREAYEELGIRTQVESLIGIYSKFSAKCSNGDEFQPITALFRAHIVSGEIKCDGEETTEARFFAKDELPEIYCEQHKAMAEDLFSGRVGTYR